MKVYSAPPPLVELVLKSVCLILGEKETWADAKTKILGRTDILEVLSKFKAGTMNDKQIKKLKEGYLNDENFVP
jgi:dynein heavy chain